MYIEGFTQSAVKAKEVASSDAVKLALNLMDLFFSKQEMASSSCTETKGKQLLDPTIVDGIRSEFSSH